MEQFYQIFLQEDIVLVKMEIYSVYLRGDRNGCQKIGYNQEQGSEKQRRQKYSLRKLVREVGKEIRKLWRIKN